MARGGEMAAENKPEGESRSARARGCQGWRRHGGPGAAPDIPGIGGAGRERGGAAGAGRAPAGWGGGARPSPEVTRGPAKRGAPHPALGAAGRGGGRAGRGPGPGRRRRSRGTSRTRPGAFPPRRPGREGAAGRKVSRAAGSRGHPCRRPWRRQGRTFPSTAPLGPRGAS